MPHFRASKPDTESQWLLDLIKMRGSPRLDSFASAVEARAVFAANCRPLDVKPIEMADVVDHRIPDATGAHKMLVRDYRPRTQPAGPTSDKGTPALVYLHGGGWVVGSPETHDNICRLLAERSGARVFSVDYRMGPEHRHPAAIDDTRAAWEWLAREASSFGVDPTRIAVGGDSAGGNLAAVLSLELRETMLPKPCLQVLIYPATDQTASAPRDPAIDEGFGLDRPLMAWFCERYQASPADQQDWRLTPMLAKSLAGAPPAYIITCGFDVLGLQGAEYAGRLRDSGVAVAHAHYPGMLHGFFNTAGALKSARAGLEATAAYLREALTAPPAAKP
jgi:acetyl esterase